MGHVAREIINMYDCTQVESDEAYYSVRGGMSDIHRKWNTYTGNEGKPCRTDEQALVLIKACRCLILTLAEKHGLPE